MLKETLILFTKHSSCMKRNKISDLKVQLRLLDLDKAVLPALRPRELA